MSRAVRLAAGQPTVRVERVVARVRRHARRLVLPALLLIATAGVGAYALAVLPEGWQRVAVGVVALLVIVVGCVLPFLAWLTQRTTITTRRVIVRSGVFARERQELLHSRGYDVTIRRTWVQSAFGSGDVNMYAGHDHPVVIRDAPNPVQVQSALDELIERAHPLVADRRRAEQYMADGDGDGIAWGGH